jgi:LPS-assembly lipoprotein
LVYTFRLVNAKNQIILPDTTLSAARAMPFDERVVQAKEGEAVTLYRDMQKSLVARMMRRLTAPDIKQRWDTLKDPSPAAQDNVETATPIQAPPDNLPTPWQIPSLTPLPIPVNPGG